MQSITTLSLFLLLFWIIDLEQLKILKKFVVHFICTRSSQVSLLTLITTCAGFMHVSTRHLTLKHFL